MKYPYNMYPAEANGHSFWVAESLALTGCAGQGDDPGTASSELAQNEDSWLDAAKELGFPIPKRPDSEVKAFDFPSLRIFARDREKRELPDAAYIVKDKCGRAVGYGKFSGPNELYMEDGDYTVFLMAPDGFADVEPREVHISDARKHTMEIEFFCEKTNECMGEREPK